MQEVTQIKHKMLGIKLMYVASYSLFPQEQQIDLAN